MRKNWVVSLIKFIIFMYLLGMFIEVVIPSLIVGFILYKVIKLVYKKVKEIMNEEKKTKETLVHEYKEKDNNEIYKKDEFKNYVINELYKLTEKCNSLKSEQKIEFLKTIKETLNEFTERYDSMIDRSYESGLVLELDTEDSLKMDFISRIVKLENEIDTEIEKNNRKSVVLNESSELQTIIGRKINNSQAQQRVLVLR